MEFTRCCSTACPLEVECETGLLRELHGWASRGRVRQGVLYGRLEGSVLRILKARPAPKAAHFQRLAADAPCGLSAAGVFAVRDSVALVPVDIDNLRHHFPAPWQVALVLAPSGPAAFFARCRDGLFHPQSSLMPVRIPSGDAPAGASAKRSWRRALAALRPPWLPRLGRGLLPVVTSAAACLGGLSLAEVWPRPMRLRLDDRQGALVVRWNPAAAGKARAAVVRIQDGVNSLVRTLDASERASGSLSFAAEGREVLVTVSFDGRRECARLVRGEPSARPPRRPDAVAEPGVPDRKLAEPAEAAASLRSDNAARADRIAALEDRLRRLTASLEPKSRFESGQ